MQPRLVFRFAALGGVLCCAVVLAAVLLQRRENNPPAPVPAAASAQTGAVTADDQKPFTDRWQAGEPQSAPPEFSKNQDVPANAPAATNAPAAATMPPPNQTLAQAEPPARVAHAELARARHRDPVCGGKGRRYFWRGHHRSWRCRR